MRIGPCYGRSVKALCLAVLLVAAACGPRATGGPIKPSSPGPLDLVRSLWGDYGGRCPGDYQYCKGRAQAVCCPITSRCEEDAGGFYCAPRTAVIGPGASTVEAPARACRSDERACSYDGEIVCCAGDERCCTVDGAPSCCP
jgi:hypothetical protein